MLEDLVWWLSDLARWLSDFARRHPAARTVAIVAIVGAAGWFLAGLAGANVVGPVNRKLSHENFVQTVQDLQYDRSGKALAFLKAVVVAKTANTGKADDVYSGFYGQTPAQIGQEELNGQDAGAITVPTPSPTPVTADNVDGVASSAIGSANDEMVLQSASTKSCAFENSTRQYPQGLWKCVVEIANTDNRGVSNMAGAISSLQSGQTWNVPSISKLGVGKSIDFTVDLAYDPSDVDLVQLRNKKTLPEFFFRPSSIVYDDGSRVPVALPTATPAAQ